MEPLRGGRLVNDLPEKAKNLFAQAEPKRTPAEWGLRWLWNQPEVAVVLSGMGSRAMVRENIRIASEARVGELGETDMKLYEDVKAAINAKMKVPCTGCGYCQPCPFSVDIPGTFRCYNVSYTDNFFVGFKEYIMCTTLRADRTNAGLCRKCGKCEQHCPQGIKIRDELDHARRRLENPAYKVVAAVIGKMVSK
jgi:predicted aldo/keto reductase-like oxidoreductase